MFDGLIIWEFIAPSAPHPPAFSLVFFFFNSLLFFNTHALLGDPSVFGDANRQNLFGSCLGAFGIPNSQVPRIKWVKGFARTCEALWDLLWVSSAPAHALSCVGSQHWGKDGLN